MDLFDFICIVAAIVPSVLFYTLYALKKSDYSDLRTSYYALLHESERLEKRVDELEVVNNILRAKEELEHGCNGGNR